LAHWSLLAPEDAPWPKNIAKLLAQSFIVKELDSATRVRLGQALAAIAGDNARAFFTQTLRHPDLSIRCDALRGFAWCGSAREMPILTNALGASTFEIRHSAILTLRDMGTAAAVRILSQTLNESDDEHLLPLIAEILAQLPQGQEVLRTAISSPDLLVRRAAAHGLSHIQQAWAQTTLEQMVREDPEWLGRSAAETALNTLRESAHITIAPPPAIDKTEWLIHWAARKGVGVGIGEAAMAILTRAIAEGDTETRLMAALTLAHIGRAEHLTLLKPFLTDENAQLKGAATQATRAIQQRYTMPA